ncbi:cytotoxic necrotizing factor Rho-activating domain-containing protein [Paraburkholderia xenovorans]|uniref:cytotoxic necrotizing factor Rho-activating domain-containing protein n=1 Tax=Paraburkholderia xenovorans TaxID=36873 RepID=UPI0038BB3B51
MPFYIIPKFLDCQRNIGKGRSDILAQDALQDDADETAAQALLYKPLTWQEAEDYSRNAVADYVARDEHLSRDMSGHSAGPDSGGLPPEQDYPTPVTGPAEGQKRPISREISHTFHNVGSRVGDWVDDRALSMKALFAGDLLKDGEVRQLKGRGLIFGAVADEPDIEFDFVRTDSVVDTSGLPPQKFSGAEVAQGGRLQGVFDTSAGNKVTSRSRNGTVIGVWGGKNVLDEDVRIFEISNGLSGTVGIKINLNQLLEGKPLIVSAGELSGCSMIYAVDDDNFYAYHAGKKDGDEQWLTSREGAASAYNAHLSLSGKSLPDVEVSNGILMDKSGTPLHGNDTLVDMVSTYRRGTMNYFGKTGAGGVNTRAVRVKKNVNIFDYNRINPASCDPRVGIAYAVLVRKNGKVRVITYSEDMSIRIKEDKCKIRTLDKSEFVLKDF